MNSFKHSLRALLPARALALYHLSLALLGALLFRFPSKQLIVIGVTGTKGKSSTTEYIASILEAGGHKVALLNSIRIKVAKDSRPNPLRMSMPGRFFIQRFLRDAVNAGCTYAVLEMTSEGSRQYRHRGVELNMLVFTNLAPEHIESHGSLQAYKDAKFELGLHLARSSKRPRTIVAHADDEESARYLKLPVEHVRPFSLSSHAPWQANEHGGQFSFGGRDITVHLPGEFSLKNALAAAEVGAACGIDADTIARGIGEVRRIPGRAERIEAGQPFTVVVDYAHTPDSLEAIYKAYGRTRKICVLGSMGGTRDSWNRPIKGEMADMYCDEIILTDEDPCDDDPMELIQSIARGVKRKNPRIIQDRREAIRTALSLAQPGDTVLITGKGTDPWMYVKNGGKLAWSDARIAREEIEVLSKKV